MIVNPESSPNTVHLNFLRIIMINVCTVLQDRVIQEELILSIALSGRTIFHSTLLLGLCFKVYSKWEYWMLCILGNTLVKEGNIERV